MPGDFPLAWVVVVFVETALGLDLSLLNSLNLFTNPWKSGS